VFILGPDTEELRRKKPKDLQGAALGWLCLCLQMLIVVKETEFVTGQCYMRERPNPRSTKGHFQRMALHPIVKDNK
jgi:hypothetical protein